MHRHTLRLCQCALLCALIIVSTLLFRFTIPGTDVMVTLQVLFVLLCGQLLPVRYCLYTTGVYLLAGLVGLPVFSAVNGPAVLATPSFGYLLGFPVAAAVCSLLRQHKSKGSRYLASLAGTAAMYAVAVCHLLVLQLVYLHGTLHFSAIISSYVLVFLPLDMIKGVAAAWLGQRLVRSVNRQL